MKRRENVVQALAVGLCLLSLYLLTYSGQFHSSDGQAMFAVTESLVRRGDYDINQLLWMGQQQGTYGLDGELYCRKGIAASLLSLPLAWLGLVVPCWGMVQTTLLFNALVTALTGVLLYLYVNRLGYSARTSLTLSLVFGLATLAWPYAKYFFSDPLASLSLLAAAYFLLRYRDNGQTSDAFWAGTSLGLAVATRFANAITLPLFGLLLLAYMGTRKRGQEARDKGQGTRDKPLSPIPYLLPPIFAFAFPLALTALLLGGYNYVRYGDVLQTGYLPQEKFSTPWLEGISGLLVSPGRGLFLHVPVLLISLLAIPAFFKRHRLEAALALLVSVSYVLLYGRWFFWHAGYAWGPRFLVPIVPFVVILMAPLMEKLSGKGWLAFAVLCLVSVAIQVLGLSVDFTLFQEGLLFRFRDLRMFDPRTYFEFQFSPLLGQWALLRLENLDFAWVRMMGSPPQLQIDWPVLTSNMALVVATALGLRWVFLREREENHRRKWRVLILMGLLFCGVASFSLSRYKDDQHRGYRELLSYLEAHSQPGNAIIFNIPEDTTILQNHYKGHLPVYGLMETSAPVTPATAGLLDKLAAQHPAFWLIPSPSLSENGLEQHLRERGYQADDKSFGELRLVLYAFPRNPLNRHTAGVTFGEAIVLAGYALDDTVRAGDVLHLDLYWQTSTPLTEDYQIFVHLLGEDGKRWAQKDGPPLLGARPTSGWQPRERLTDRRGLLLPSDIPPGSYHLRVGLYHLSDGSRLFTAEGADGLDLGPFSVTASE